MKKDTRATAPDRRAVAQVNEEKKLTEIQKLKLFNVHLRDKNIELEKKLATQLGEIAQLRLDNAELQRQVHEGGEAANVFKELGISRGDNLTLAADGTLLIQRPKPPAQELFPKAKDAKPEPKAEGKPEADKPAEEAPAAPEPAASGA